MSSSRYTETTTTAPGVSRNYSDNSQYRGNTNYRDVDYEDARHHGRWTASGESRDLADSTGRVHRDRDHDGRRDFSRDRDFNRDRDHDRDYDRTRGYQSGYESAYGSGLPYESHYGSSYGMGSSFPHHYGSGYGMGSTLPHHYGSGYGSGYGMGSSFPQHYGSSYGMGSSLPHHYGSGYGMGSSFPQHYGSGYGMGSTFPHHYGSGYGMGSGMTSRSVRGSSYGTPEVDIYEVGNDYIIELDLPGHSRDHVDTKLYGNELVITSKPPRRSHNFHINERSLGSSDVSRRLYLPNDAHTGQINATLTNGVLKVIIPRNMTTGATTGATTGLGSVLPTTGSVLPTTGNVLHSGTTPATTLVKDTVTTTTETRRI